MRVFIATDIGENVRRAISDLQQQLRSKADINKSDVKWVRPERIHLTLRFLGEVEDKRIVSVCDAVRDAVSRHESFELDVESVGYFGGKSARVLWVGTGRGSDNLHRLQKDIEGKLALAGWSKETREFSGHLTLCRIRKPTAAVKLAEMSEAYKDFKVGRIGVDSVCVYESQLRPSGPIYTVLGKFKLQ